MAILLPKSVADAAQAQRVGGFGASGSLADAGPAPSAPRITGFAPPTAPGPFVTPRLAPAGPFVAPQTPQGGSTALPPVSPAPVPGGPGATTVGATPQIPVVQPQYTNPFTVQKQTIGGAFSALGTGAHLATAYSPAAFALKGAQSVAAPVVRAAFTPTYSGPVPIEPIYDQNGNPTTNASAPGLTPQQRDFLQRQANAQPGAGHVTLLNSGPGGALGGRELAVGGEQAPKPLDLGPLGYSPAQTLGAMLKPTYDTLVKPAITSYTPQALKDVPVAGPVLSELGRPVNYIPFAGEAGIAGNVARNIGGVLGAEAGQKVGDFAFPHDPILRATLMATGGIVGYTGGGMLANYAAELAPDLARAAASGARGTGRVLQTGALKYAEATKNLPIGMSVKEVGGGAADANAANPELVAAKAALSDALKGEVAIRRSGVAEAEKAAGRSVQAGRIASNLEAARAQGARPE